MEGGKVSLWCYVMVVSQVSWGSLADYTWPSHDIIVQSNDKKTVDLTNNKNMYKHSACRRIINYATVEIERQEKKKLELDSCKNTSGQFSQM